MSVDMGIRLTLTNGLRPSEEEAAWLKHVEEKVNQAAYDHMMNFFVRGYSVLPNTPAMQVPEGS